MKTGGEVIIVGIDGGREITEHAIEWVVRNVATSLDSLILLALLPSSHYYDATKSNHPTASPAPSAADNATRHSLRGLMKKWVTGKIYRDDNPPDSLILRAVQQEEARRINDLCLNIIRRHSRIHGIQLHSQVKVIGDPHLGCVASAAKDLDATWVVLDRRLKREVDFCTKQLKCNIVVMEHSVPKVMKTMVNPRTRSSNRRGEIAHQTSTNELLLPRHQDAFRNNTDTNNTSATTTLASFGGAYRDTGSALSSSNDSFGKKKKPSNSVSPLLHLNFELAVQRDAQVVDESINFDDSPSNILRPPTVTTSNGKVIKSYSGLLSSEKRNTRPARRSFDASRLTRLKSNSQRKPSRKNSMTNNNDGTNNNNNDNNNSLVGEQNEGPSNIGERTSSIRMVISISSKPPPSPPPLCSMCKHIAPIFGKAPKKFTYKEMEAATQGFSSEKLLAEDERHVVYRGELPDGQAVTVKKYKAVTSHNASEFCSEVEVLSCAQHRNLVMLVGYCVERVEEWMLVYEFVCNRSLENHLYGKKDEGVMAWEHRMKVAIGVARGLRYLHEDCRVGCIVHRDFRPQNILLTHDFEAMVGDFGLARWQSDGQQQAEETRVIDATGYLAPEYVEAGLITEKADVYAFGMVLLELLCGVKTMELSTNMGPKFLLDLGHWLQERAVVNEILDPRLQDSYVENDVKRMIYACGLCLSSDPETRPKMSKVLKILEGDVPLKVLNNNVEPETVYPNQFVNMMYGSETPMFSVAKAHPYLRRNSFIVGDESRGKFGTWSSIRKKTGGYRNVGGDYLKQGEMDFSGEYKAYIQGSLVDFFEALNRHGKATSDDQHIKI